MKNKKSAVSVLIGILFVTMVLGGCGGKEEPEIVLGDTPTSETVSEEESVPETPSEEQSVSESVEESEPVEEPAVSEEPVESEELPASVSDGGAQGYFTTTDLYGNEVTQQIFANAELTVVNVWATYCGPCINEMPYLGELSHEYDSAQVRIVGIPMDAMNAEYVEYATSLVSQTGADYQHLLLNEELYNWGLTEIQYVPTTFFVNSEGEIIDSVVGSMSKEDWKSLIDSKLASQ